MCYLDDFAKNFSSAVGFFFDGSPGAPRPGPRPLFCRQKRGEKTASPPVPGAGPRAIRGVYGGFLRCKPGKCVASTRRRALRADWRSTYSACRLANPRESSGLVCRWKIGERRDGQRTGSPGTAVNEKKQKRPLQGRPGRNLSEFHLQSMR